MAEETIEQMNRLLDSPKSLPRAQAEQMMANRDREKSLMAGTGAVSDMEMQGMAPPMRPQGMGAVSKAEIDMITSAQEGLMAIDPQGAQDIVQGMETTKARVAQGKGLTESEFMGIRSILEKIGNAFSDMMDGGETMTYMVDGNPVEMTEREMMSAKNAGMIVQDMGTYQVDDRMERMTPDTYADRVARGEITPDELMMESTGSTMTEAEKAIRDNAEFNRRVQEEQERVFRMNNPPSMSSVRPRLRPSPKSEDTMMMLPSNPPQYRSVPSPEGAIPAVPMPNVMPDLSPEEMEQMRIMREIRERQSLERDPSGMTQLLGG